MEQLAGTATEPGFGLNPRSHEYTKLAEMPIGKVLPSVGVHVPMAAQTCRGYSAILALLSASGTVQPDRVAPHFDVSVFVAWWSSLMASGSSISHGLLETPDDQISSR